jgi:hypothetical protein
MDTISRNDVETLARHRGPWCVSIYLPTELSTNGRLGNPIRFKNLINEAEARLEEHGLRAPEARESVEPLRDLLAKSKFWTAVSDGLAIFLDGGRLQTYRLPQRFADVLFVGKRFHIKPLLPLIGGGNFFVLAISGNRVRMLEGDRWSLKELPVPGLPANMPEALHYDKPEEVRQVHTASRGGPHGTQMSFHGQGGGRDAAKTEVIEFLRVVDRALAKYLADKQTPLVFAGVQYLFPMFKQVCSYSHLVETAIAGNTDAWNDKQLHERAWAIVKPLFERDREEAVVHSRRSAGTDYELLQLDRVLTACHLGQVETLLVDLAESRWGTFDASAGTMHLDPESRPGNEELLDLAVALTLENRGKVFAADKTELPDQSPLTALLRYPSTATPVPRTPALMT